MPYSTRRRAGRAGDAERVQRGTMGLAGRRGGGPQGQH